MNYYTPDTNKRGKTIAAIASAAYVAIWLILFLTIKIGFTVHAKSYDGILIEFGTTEEGMGDIKPPVADAAVAVPPANTAPPRQRPVQTRPVQTQNVEEAPAVRQTPPTERTVSNTEPEQADVRQNAEQARDVNPRALFPGRNPEQGAEASTGYGSGTQPGNQGNLAGDHGGSGAGTGTGTEGHSFNLTGRRLVGNFPVPVYPGKNKSGRILVEITVDDQGVVVAARQIIQGSTTQDQELVNAAISAAKKARFTSDGNNPVQTGTITYIFKLN